MEFELKTDLSVLPAELKTNLQEVKAWVLEQTARYEQVVLDESQTAWAKSDMARMRKLGKALDEARLDVKRQWMKPYMELEAQCKEIRGILDAAVNGLDAQVKAFEQAKRESKKANLCAFFAENVQEASEYVSFEDVFDAKWLNAGVPLEKAKDEMLDIIQKYREDVQALQAACNRLSPEGAFAISEKYKETKSIPQVMAFLTRMRDVEGLKDAAKDVPERSPAVDEPQWEMVFRVRGTPEQFMRLKEFLVQTGMIYEKV